jgi:hypothetical protein
MLRTALLSTLAALGLVAGTAEAQVRGFPGVAPGYRPDFQYQYGGATAPSQYHRPQPIRPGVQIYTVQFRRGPWDVWRIYARTYNEREARSYARYLRSLGFQAIVTDRRY